MLVEISVAVNYILSNLYTKLPRRRVDSFGEELEKHLHSKYKNHWHSNDPAKDSNYRCLNLTGCQIDSLLSETAAMSGLEWNEIKACLPDGLTINVDPGQVSCQYNQSGTLNYEKLNSLSSSSGCSSSSSISSSSPQITHQILYCSNKNWASSNILSDVTKPCDYDSGKYSNSEQDHGSLATAAALSVLIEPDDGSNVKFDSNMYFNSNNLQSHWNADGFSPFNHEDHNFMHFDELGGGYPASSFNFALNWNQMNEHELVSKSEHKTIFNNIHSNILNNSKMLINSSSLPFSTCLASNHLNEYMHCGGPDYKSINTAATSNNNNIINNNNGLLFGSNSTALTKPLSVPIGGLTSSNAGSKVLADAFVIPKSTSTPSFTAATFAQTKFGSTKLKNHSKRVPTRITSPTTMMQPPAIGSESINNHGLNSFQQMLDNKTNNLSSVWSSYLITSKNSQPKSDLLSSDTIVDPSWTGPQFEFNAASFGDGVGLESIYAKSDFVNPIMPKTSAHHYQQQGTLLYGQTQKLGEFVDDDEALLSAQMINFLLDEDTNTFNGNHHHHYHHHHHHNKNYSSSFNRDTELSAVRLKNGDNKIKDFIDEVNIDESCSENVLQSKSSLPDALATKATVESF